MKLITFKLAGETRVGKLINQDREILSLSLSNAQAEHGICAAIEAGLDTTFNDALLDSGTSPIPMESVITLPPIPRPARNIFCVGKNYHEHAKEFAGSGFDSSASMGDIPQAPIIFSKVPESVIADKQDIEYCPEVSEAIDYEVELAVIIGKPGHRISAANALDHVWGYTVINDVTARDWQSRHQQWHLGKSFPTFCPMGPVAVTADEIDLNNTMVRSFVNGELRQEANTKDFIFDVPTVIECISAAIPLLPGDIIATGTPAGVGIGFNPPKYLKDGDRVAVEVEGIGRLENGLRRI